MADPITLDEFPRVIEPSVNVLEVVVRGAGGPVPVRLFRLSPAAAHALASVTFDGAHFFGNAEEAGACDYVLVYSTHGLLTGVLTTEDDEWIAVELPIEGNGSPTVKPSVRLVFKDERARSVFLYYLDGVRSGKFSNPTIAQALEGLAEDPRIIDVGAKA